MKLSVNILTWNCVNTIQPTLDILKEDLADIEHEIIIVDNGSNDGSEKLATIANKENKGISTGKNQGILASKGEFILMLDGDVVPVPNTVNCLLKWLDDNPNEYAIGIYGNRWSNQKNNKFGQKHHENHCDVLTDIVSQGLPCLYFGVYRRSMFVNFDIMMDETGPFAGVGYGWEDRDLYMQMEEKGIKQWVSAINHFNGKYYHEINSSIRVMGHDKFGQSSRIRAEYFKDKWGDYVRRKAECASR